MQWIPHIVRHLCRHSPDGRKPSAAASSPFVEWLFNPFERMSAAWKRYLAEGADNSSPRNVMARAEIVLHGPQHWLNQLMALVFLAGLTVLSFTAVGIVYDIDIAAVIRDWTFGIGIGIGIAGLNPGLALPGMLWQSRRDQALLRLLPGMPQGAALNRAVAARQLRDFSVGWALTMLAMHTLSAYADDAFMLYLPMAALPVGVLNLTRRPATMSAPTAMTAVFPMFALLALGAVLFLLARTLDLQPWQVAAPLAALTAALLTWRWHRLAAAPMALPAGRLA